MASSIPPLTFETLDGFALPAGRLALIAGRMIDGFDDMDWRMLASAAAAARAELAAIEAQLAEVEEALRCSGDGPSPDAFLFQAASSDNGFGPGPLLPRQTHILPKHMQ